jgi:hypothetical protein
MKIDRNASCHTKIYAVSIKACGQENSIPVSRFGGPTTKTLDCKTTILTEFRLYGTLQFFLANNRTVPYISLQSNLEFKAQTDFPEMYGKSIDWQSPGLSAT